MPLMGSNPKYGHWRGYRECLYKQGVCIKGFMFKFKSKTLSITKQNTKEIIEGLEDIGIFK